MICGSIYLSIHWLMLECVLTEDQTCSLGKDALTNRATRPGLGFISKWGTTQHLSLENAIAFSTLKLEMCNVGEHKVNSLTSSGDSQCSKYLFLRKKIEFYVY